MEVTVSLGPSIHQGKKGPLLIELYDHSEEEDPDDYAFPLTLKAPKKLTAFASPLESPSPAEPLVNGIS